MSAPGYEPDIEPRITVSGPSDGGAGLCYGLAVACALAAACLLAVAAVGSDGRYAWAAVAPAAAMAVLTAMGRLVDRSRERALRRAALPDTCRPVELPSGAIVAVLGEVGPSPAASAAIAHLVEVARRLGREPEAGAVEMLGRVEAVCDARALSWRLAALEAGVTHAVLMRLTQGVMPKGYDLEAVTGWLAAQEARAEGGAA